METAQAGRPAMSVRSAQKMTRSSNRSAMSATLRSTSVSPLPNCDVDTAKQYQDLGVERLVLVPVARSEDDFLRFIDETASGLMKELS